MTNKKLENHIRKLSVVIGMIGTCGLLFQNCLPNSFNFSGGWTAAPTNSTSHESSDGNAPQTGSNNSSNDSGSSDVPPRPPLTEEYCQFNPNYRLPSTFASLVISDDFQYRADRNDINAHMAFLNAGWTGVKSNQTNPT